jgi:NAD(P)-dependent dehydrogenase (short-subunit alcohol dehydrogenase family)
MILGDEQISHSRPLEGRVALVTGAAQGIGRGIARSLGDAGARVMLSDINQRAGEETTRLLRESGHDADFTACDLSSADAISALVAATAQRDGRLDVIVNNARPRLSVDPFPANLASWDLALNVMVKAPALTIAAALPHLASSGAASVINIASTNAFLVSHQPLVYHVAKAAIVQLTRHLAVELGPRGIRVNAICPALVDIEDRPKKLSDDPAFATVIESIVPLKRAASVHDIGSLVVFLSSDQSAYLTGQAIVLDGGMTIGDQFTSATRAIDSVHGGRPR